MPFATGFSHKAIPAASAALLCLTLPIAIMVMSSGGLAGFCITAYKHLQFLTEKANQEQWAGDVRFELVPFDTKMSPQVGACRLAISQ